MVQDVLDDMPTKEFLHLAEVEEWMQAFLSADQDKALGCPRSKWESVLKLVRSSGYGSFDSDS